MSVYSEASPTDKAKIRREMIRIAAENMTGFRPARAKTLARIWVDGILAKERHETNQEADTSLGSEDPAQSLQGVG